MPPAGDPVATPSAAIELLSPPVAGAAFPVVWYESCNVDNFWFQWRMRILRQSLQHLRVPLMAPWRALDIGCGAGVTKQQLATFTPWVVDGTDLNLTALHRQPPLPGRVMHYDILSCRPEFHEHYDVALLLDVLEHIKSTRPFLVAALAHLRPGGLLLLNVPALMTLYSNYDRVQGHYRRYTPARLRAEFAGLPVDCLHTQYWATSMVPVALLRRFLVRHKHDPEEVMQQGFAPPSPLVHEVLRTCMRVETTCLRWPPLGTSVFAVLRKHGSATEPATTR